MAFFSAVAPEEVRVGCEESRFVIDRSVPVALRLRSGRRPLHTPVVIGGVA